MSHRSNNFSNSNESPFNTRPAHLETDQDLLRDQLNYYRASNQSPPPPSSTPTSSCLQSIKERVVPSNSRRRPRSRRSTPTPHSFPQVPSITDHTPHRFARKSRQPQTQHYHDPSISEQVTARVQSMSIEQIRAAQQEIHDTLKPETIHILNKLWLRNRQNASHSHPPSVPLPQTPKPEQSSSANQPQPDPIPVNHPLSTDAHTELLIPTKTYESDEEERNKRAWMTDADEPGPSQAQIDQLLDKAMHNLGPVGKMRFTLTGTVLSPEEIQTLPTHLGLHHHGSSPGSAGYTLTDILVLMRSTVVIQRVIAMRILKSIVIRHRNHVLPPLVESGTLTPAFSHLVLDPSVYAAITNQSAYLELVEALVGDYLLLDEDEDHNPSDLYFGSNFYSPCPVMSSTPVIKSLADSDAVTALIEISRAALVLPEHVPLAERSLRLVQLFVASAPQAACKLLQSTSSLLTLKSFVTTTESYPNLFLSSCNVLVGIVVSLGWRGDQVLKQLQEELINDRFLERLSSRMVWLLDSDIEEITEEQSVTANGVLRLMRGALTFQRGIEVFAALAHVVCRLVCAQATATESYLALEAYSHALFVQATSPAENGPDKTSSPNVHVDAKHDQINQLTARGLSNLIPTAISAVTFFVNAKSRSGESIPAAGHFGATLFALTSHPILEVYVIKALNRCSESTKELAELVESSPESIQKIRILASTSHATARLLSKVKLEEGFIEREIRVLTRVLGVEEAATKEASTASLTRIVANACAEWIGLYSRVGSSKRTAELAIELLPRLSDVRVIVDLLSRTLLNVGVLRDLCKDMSDVTAQRCVKDLMSVVMAELTSPQESQWEDSRASCLMSFKELCNLWITNESVFDSLISVLEVFYRCKVLEVTPLFECLLQAPVSKYSDLLFEFLFRVAQSCVNRSVPLIASPSKTVLSSLSTTINSPVADSALSLCDFLLSRGPAPTTSTCHEEPDFLSSVLMALMCGPDIDKTLRASMWKRTVDDCGGAILYQNAVALEEGSSRAATGASLELESLLRMFGGSIAEGYLDGERCPPTLKGIIFAQIEAALSTGKTSRDVFELMACSVRSRSSLSEQLVRLTMTMPGTTMDRDKLLSGFRDEVRVLS